MLSLGNGWFGTEGFIFIFETRTRVHGFVAENPCGGHPSES